MTSPAPRATIFDKATFFFPHLFKVIVAVVYRSVSYPFISSKHQSPLKDIVFAALRQNLGSISAEQEQWTLSSSTANTYLALARKQQFQPESTVLDSGLKLHWIGSKASEKVVLFFHGGGYVLPSSPGHLQWLFDLQQELSKKKSTSVIVVGYTLAPQGVYPQQLQQAAEALNWLIGKHGMKPSDVVIAGDSAGGNLCLALMSHILHPHPEVMKVDLQDQPLTTAVLISPWVSFSTDDASFKSNAHTDMIPPGAVKRWSSLFLGGKATDQYTEPVTADSQWFSGLDRVSKDVLIWGGGAEVLIDSIRKCSKMLQSAHPATQLIVQEGAGHDEFMIEVNIGGFEKAEGTRVIESWIAERI